jgi:hypothetical protein
VGHVLIGVDQLDADVRPGRDDDGWIGYPGDAGGPVSSVAAA